MAPTLASTSQNKCSISSVVDDDSDARGNQPKRRMFLSLNVRYFRLNSTIINTAKKKCATVSSPQLIIINDLNSKSENADDDILTV